MAKDYSDALMNNLISLNNVSLTYRVPHGAAPTLKETFMRILKRQNSDVQINAVKQVTFDVKRGEVLGVIGGNGAGKSSLLKILARVLPPTTGRVRIHGKISPMIELGAGFNGELSGRENIILYGTLLGRSPKEMEKQAEEIADWANLSNSIDLPLRTYSSGMVAKLAFSIATNQPSDILLIDEVLSVGDSDFQNKSFDRIKRLFKDKAAVVLVSHDMNAIRTLATKAIWLDNGRVAMYGNVKKVLESYLSD